MAEFAQDRAETPQAPGCGAWSSGIVVPWFVVVWFVPVVRVVGSRWCPQVNCRQGCFFLSYSSEPLFRGRACVGVRRGCSGGSSAWAAAGLPVGFSGCGPALAHGRAARSTTPHLHLQVVGIYAVAAAQGRMGPRSPARRRGSERWPSHAGPRRPLQLQDSDLLRQSTHIGDHCAGQAAAGWSRHRFPPASWAREASLDVPGRGARRWYRTR